jgi:hypothetical protein
MTLTRAHAQVEGGHRSEAWRVVLENVREGGHVARSVVATCEQALTGWLAYRDGVADRMELSRP